MTSTEDEQLDPRVQVELEKLNTATDDINKLESRLEEANNVFRATLAESTARLKALAKKLGNCIEKARPFYEAQELAKSSQLECQRAAVQYQRANALHQAAKETIALAEERFVNCRHEHWQFDSAWQEMLNHATMKVMEAEAQKAASEREHLRRASAFTQAEQRVQQLQRGLRSSINKSLVYFEEKTLITSQLEGQKERVQQLQRAISASKSSYAQSLRSLELISEEIHEQRRCRMPREPGVGAELTPPEVSDAQCYSGTSAKPFTPLEEMTAKDEKYWETLREKLERLQVMKEHSLSTEEEVLSDVESPPGRERTVTGSSCASNPEIDHHDIEEERIISGESSLGSDSDDAQSPTEGRENVFGFKSAPNSSKYDLDRNSIHCENIQIIDIQDIEMELVSEKNEMHCNDEVRAGGEGSMSMGAMRTAQATEDLFELSLENRKDIGKRDCVTGSGFEDLDLKPSCKRDSDEVESIYIDEDDDEDDDGVHHYEVKERGDGASSPPPAMCQPSRKLCAIPE